MELRNYVTRYSIREIITKNDNNEYRITGLSYDVESDGNWVMYTDIQNLIEDRNIALNLVKELTSILKQEHRGKNNET